MATNPAFLFIRSSTLPKPHPHYYFAGTIVVMYTVLGASRPAPLAPPTVVVDNTTLVTTLPFASFTTVDVLDDADVVLEVALEDVVGNDAVPVCTLNGCSSAEAGDGRTVTVVVDPVGDAKLAGGDAAVTVTVSMLPASMLG